MCIRDRLDADLSAATKTAIFKKAFPDHHINCGIAESNMTVSYTHLINEEFGECNEKFRKAATNANFYAGVMGPSSTVA